MPVGGRRFGTWIAALAILVLCVEPAMAQDAGRWWWQTTVGLWGRTYENRVDDVSTSRFRAKNLSVGFGLNGYIVHPRVVPFQVSVGLSTARNKNGVETGTDLIGLGAGLQLFPQGAYPSSLFFRKNAYDHREAGVDGPIVYGRSPDTATAWGGRFRVRRGIFGGTLLGFDRNTVDFEDPERRPDIRDRQFVDWSTRTLRSQSHLRLQRDYRDLGASDRSWETYKLDLNERLAITSRWRWRLNGVGYQRDSFLTDETVRTRSFRMTNQFDCSLPNGDQLSLSQGLGLSQPSGSATSRTGRLSARYRWHPTAELEVVPSLAYTQRSVNGTDVQSPGVFVGVNWQRRLGTVDTLVGGSTGYSLVKQDGPPGSTRDSQSSYGVHGSFGHGRAEGLRKNLDVEIGRREFRLTQDPVGDPPGLGLVPEATGAEDRARIRLDLRHRWDRSGVGGWVEWVHRSSSDRSLPGSFESDSFNGSVQLEKHAWGIAASWGLSTVSLQTLDDQRFGHVGANAWWRPWRFLRFFGSYRVDDRNIEIGPDRKGRQLNLGLVSDFGQFRFQATAFRYASWFADGTESTERNGLKWSISWRYAGWLPIVTGIKRRGVIR
jgi:hypothetical protein